jgi:hypothetical protein
MGSSCIKLSGNNYQTDDSMLLDDEYVSIPRKKYISKMPFAESNSALDEIETIMSMIKNSKDYKECESGNTFFLKKK